MKTILKLAGIPIEIQTLYPSLPIGSAAFETKDTPAFCVEISERDIADEREKSMAECAYEGLDYPDYTETELESTAVYRKIAKQLPLYDAFVFHGAGVAVGEQAFLFTAKSGTGKTTHIKLWLKNIDGSFVVNGDKPILRLMNGQVYVCGTPWMGKEQLGCAANVPLKGLCILNRGEKNSIGKVEFPFAAPRLIGQAYRPPEGDAMIRTIKLIEKIGKSVALYELYCNMEDGAAIVAYDGMR